MPATEADENQPIEADWNVIVPSSIAARRTK